MLVGHPSSARRCPAERRLDSKLLSQSVRGIQYAERIGKRQLRLISLILLPCLTVRGFLMTSQDHSSSQVSHEPYVVVACSIILN